MKLMSVDGTLYPLDKPQIRIGRSASNDVVVADKRASGKHAVITVDGDALLLSDVGSSNGSFVNKNRVETPARLKIGDQLMFGDTVLTVVDDNQGDRLDATITDVDGPGTARPVPAPKPASPPPPPMPSPAPMAVAPPPPIPAPQVIAPYPQPYAPISGYTAPKDKSMVIILELLPGLLGFAGFGWIYAGQTTTGILILIGNMVVVWVLGVITALTGGLGLLCLCPVEIGIVAISAFMVNDYTNKNPQLFR